MLAGQGTESLAEYWSRYFEDYVFVGVYLPDVFLVISQELRAWGRGGALEMSALRAHRSRRDIV